MTEIGAVAGTIPVSSEKMQMDELCKQAEPQRRALQRAMSQRGMSITDFCARYGVGRTTAFGEIKAKRLRARKCGKRTIITEEDAEDWLRRLPTMEAAQ